MQKRSLPAETPGWRIAYDIALRAKTPSWDGIRRRVYRKKFGSGRLDTFWTWEEIA